MREEKLEKRWREWNPVPYGTTEVYSKLAIKSQQTSPVPGIEPGSSCTEICYSLPLAIVARLFRLGKNLHHILVISHGRSNDPPSHVQPSKTFNNLL